MIITVTLNPALDKTVQISGFTIGGVNRVESSRFDIGGKGINVAKVIRNLGHECTAMGFLSGRSGQYIEKCLEEIGIDCDFVHTAGETRTNIKIADMLRQTNTDLNENGPTVSPKAIEELEERLLNRVSAGDIVVFSGSVPPGVDCDIYRKWITLMKSIGADTILDADGELFCRGIMAGPGAVKPNVHELEIFCHRPLQTPEEVMEEAGKMFSYGVDTVLVSMGSLGAILLSKSRMIHSPGLPVMVESTVGAGDAMVAALAIARQRGDCAEDTLRLAAACGTASVMTQGTQAPSLETVKRLILQVPFDLPE